VRVLVLGGGGREHAIAWKLKHDEPSVDLIAAPGNPGIAELGRCVRINTANAGEVVELAESLSTDLVIVGPEAPLAAGVVDALRARGLTVFGPTASAARIEASKRFSKELMLRAGIPTARATVHDDPASAMRSIRALGAPVVVKASGLAAGKGVVVASTVEEAEHAVEQIMLRSVYGAAGAEVLVEEFMDGEELSVFAVTDGTHFVLLPPAQDHKRLLEGDLGPNTGGMGAYTPVSIATPSLVDEVAERVIAPTLHAMRVNGTPFTGLLYAGLMLTEAGPKVVEFNCRFGDPETQSVLPALEGPLVDLLQQASTPGGLGASTDRTATNVAAVTTVVAAPGYPEAPHTGAPIVLPDSQEGVTVFHAGTARRDDGTLVSAGGRVVAVTGIADTIAAAALKSREHAGHIRLDGAHFRRDIGWREQARHARTP
jgi:phosphoribosylamine--glycine ligase